MLVCHKDKEGNSRIHLALREKMAAGSVKWFLENGVVLTRNYFGQSALHFAVKYHTSISEVTELLLEYGASVSEIDNYGSSVLHEALKNSSVTLESIEKLLKLGAPPDYRDEAGKPPLAYCESSSLQPDRKLAAEKMIIQYSVVRKMKEMTDQEFGFFANNRPERFDDAILCLNFPPECRRRNEFFNIRDSCITEISRMKSVSFDESDEWSLLDFLTGAFQDCELTDDNIITIIDELRKNKYQNFRVYLLSELEEYEFYTFEFLVEKIKWYTNKSNSSENIVLSSDCIKKICSFLTLRDVINLFLV